MASATDLGAAAQETSLHLLVSLKLANTTVLYSYFQHITTPGDPLYGQYLTPDQFAASYSPTMAQASQVINYLVHAGFTNITLSPNRTVLRFDGTVGQAQAAFNTTIHQFQLNGSSVLANVEPAQVPAQFASLVLSVTGLNTVPNMAVHPVTQGALPPGPPSLNSLSGYTPQQYQTAYDADPTQDGSGANIAIIAEGDLTTVLTDLVTFEDMYSLPHVSYSVIPVGFDHTDVSGADEFDLDTQSSTGLAGNVKHLYIYDGAALNDIELIAEYNQYVTDDLASAASASVAGCESTEYAFGELSAYDQVFLQMATQGQTLFNSSGDSGAACLNPAGNGIPAGVPGVEYPTSSPYVMGVGGTTLLVNADNTYNYEIAWYSGGGGTSVFEPAASWQLPVLPTGAAGTGLKGVPDMAMDADANTGALVVVNGAVETIGGTSLASPLSLGAWARMQSAHNNQLGYAPPDLYGLGTAPLTAVPGFNDVILGNNAGYSATPGWDYTTGLGTFDIKAITALLKPVTAPLAPAPSLQLGGSPCTIPGDKIAVGAVGGEIDQLPAHNVLNVYVAEPPPASGNAADDSFVFSLDVASLATVPPETAYLVYYFLPDGSEHYVAYEATPDPSATSPFTYGDITVSMTATLLINFIPVQKGYADAGSAVDTANNRVTWVLNKSKIDGYVEGQSTLSQVYGEADIEVTPIADNMASTTTMGTNEVINDTPQGNYTPDDNASCSALAAGTGTGTTTGTGSGTGTTTGTGTGTSSGTGTGTTSTATPVSGPTGGAASMGWGSLLVLAPLAALRRRRRQ